MRYPHSVILARRAPGLPRGADADPAQEVPKAQQSGVFDESYAESPDRAHDVRASEHNEQLSPDSHHELIGRIAMKREIPPFRGDMVGSLLRTPSLKTARERHEAGQLSAAALREIEDREIRDLVRKEEAVGLQAVTHGEYRRVVWHFDFLEHLTGVQGYLMEHGIAFKGVATKPKGVRVVGKLGFPSNHPHLEHFKFLKSVTSRVPKMTIPSPRCCTIAAAGRRSMLVSIPTWMATTRTLAKRMPRQYGPSMTPAAAISSSIPASPTSAIPSSARCSRSGGMIRLPSSADIGT